jgi:hypothetical protein
MWPRMHTFFRYIIKHLGRLVVDMNTYELQKLG